MAIEQKDVSNLFILLSHQLRRDILLLLNQKNEQSFTDLLTTFEVDTGTLSFHLRKLKILLEQTSTNKYKLNKLGLTTIRLIKDFETLSIETQFAKDSSSFPIATKKKRTAAFLMDSGIAFTITVATTIIANISQLFLGNFSLDLNIILFLTFLWLYSTLLEGFSGQTIGKAIFGLKVENITGKKLSYDSAAVRNFGKTFFLPIDLLAGIRIHDKRYIRYFDKFAGTTVINIRI
jgi:uncharacterized RDD family membrane protein YckC